VAGISRQSAVLTVLNCTPRHGGTRERTGELVSP
jgi:hypothetical protein